MKNEETKIYDATAKFNIEGIENFMPEGVTFQDGVRYQIISGVFKGGMRFSAMCITDEEYNHLFENMLINNAYKMGKQDVIDKIKKCLELDK